MHFTGYTDIPKESQNYRLADKRPNMYSPYHWQHESEQLRTFISQSETLGSL